MAIEDRLIGASLRNYVGAEREKVMQVFGLFAAFPEDVSVPVGLFDELARHTPQLFGMAAGAKRPYLKVRSWLTALKKLSLLLGTMGDGFYMHGSWALCSLASFSLAPLSLRRPHSRPRPPPPRGRRRYRARLHHLALQGPACAAVPCG